MKIILASASPRRVQLIKQIEGLSVCVIPSNAEENADKSDPELFVKTLAYQKAKEVYDRVGGKVIGADTVVVDGMRILGKPKDDADAKLMLSSLCGKTHRVLTGVCLINDGGEHTESVTCTNVTFKDYDEDCINAYVATKSPLDKAGAYGIQDKELAPLVKSVDGDINNVIGFPVQTVRDMIKTFFIQT